MNKKTSVNGKALKESDVAYPCGLIAKSVFNGLILSYFDQTIIDTYEI